MRLVIQRVKQASVSVDGQIAGQCGHGLCILAGVRVGDTEAEAKWRVKTADQENWADWDGRNPPNSCYPLL